MINVVVGAEDCKCFPDINLLSDAKSTYGYSGILLVNKHYKDFALCHFLTPFFKSLSKTIPPRLI